MELSKMIGSMSLKNINEVFVYTALGCNNTMLTPTNSHSRNLGLSFDFSVNFSSDFPVLLKLSALIKYI